MKTDRSATLVIPILGHPVAQVATPSLWNAVFAARGQDAVCVPFDLPPEGLEPFYDWVRLADNVPGFLTTIPHKAALATVCDELGAAAQFLGAANTVRKLPNGGFGGDMFDGHGMLDAIAATGTDIAGRHVVICGAGAAGSAIALEALSRGAAAMTILDHDPDRAATVAHRLGKTTGVTPSTALSDAPAQDGILINASPAGSPGTAPPPFCEALVAAAACVADALTDPAQTELIARARQLGRVTVTGPEMAACQASRMRAFLGLDPMA